MKSIVFISVLFSIFCLTVYAQNPTPNDPTNPSVYPDPIVKPSENLDPYGSSSLNSSIPNYNKSKSTFGSSNSDRPSNSEINKKLQEKKAKDRKIQIEKQNAEKDYEYEGDSSARDYFPSSKNPENLKNQTFSAGLMTKVFYI